jgi:hypothetical protein
VSEESSAEHSDPRIRKLNQHEAGREIMRWVALSKRSVNELLDTLEDTVVQVPFNLVQGQWFLGTEPLPNQDELDRAKQNVQFLESVSEERHHRIMDLVDERNRLQAEVERLRQAEALLGKVFSALDGEDGQSLIGHYAKDGRPAYIGGLGAFTHLLTDIDYSVMRKDWDELTKDEKILRGSWSAQHWMITELGELRRAYDDYRGARAAEADGSPAI